MVRTLLLSAAAVCLIPASALASQSELHCYGASTQVGVAARRDFSDANGFVTREIFYVSTESSVRPSCADGTLRVHSSRDYQRDPLGRVLVETDLGPDGIVQHTCGDSSIVARRRHPFGECNTIPQALDGSRFGPKMAIQPICISTSAATSSPSGARSRRTLRGLSVGGRWSMAGAAELPSIDGPVCFTFTCATTQHRKPTPTFSMLSIPNCEMRKAPSYA